jgi:hypothetical protein
MGAMLPPTVFRLSVSGTHANLCVVTTKQRATQTSSQARDLHPAGRLSKRIAVVTCEVPRHF